jgi:predicted DNA-binding protein
MKAKETRTTIRIREDLLLKMKLLASLKGKTFTELLNKALEEYLQKHEEELRRKVSEVINTEGGLEDFLPSNEKDSEVTNG